MRGQVLALKGGLDRCRLSHIVDGGEFAVNSLLAQALLDLGDVGLAHLHHRVEDTLRRRMIGVGVGVGEYGDQGTWRDLPPQAPLVLAPAAGAGLAAVADDCASQAISFGLIVCCHLEQIRLVVPERRAAIECQARDAQHREDRRAPVVATNLLAISGRWLGGPRWCPSAGP